MLQVGDTIKCHDADDMIRTMTELEKRKHNHRLYVRERRSKRLVVGGGNERIGKNE